MIIDVLLKKIIEILIIKIYEKKERTIVLISFLSLPFNFIKFKSVRVYIITVESSRGADLVDLIRSES